MSDIYVIGHKSPDTDTIASAIAYAYLKGKIDKANHYIPARAGKINEETAFVLKKFNTPEPVLLENAAGKNIILVDHNEMGQTVDGIEEAHVLEVIDHHRIGDLQTRAPILFHAEPVGSTATIITHFFYYHNVSIPDHIAGLLLAAILSDTVVFKSPTTTEKDREMAGKLAKQTGLDPQKFGLEVKKAKSSIKGKTANEVIMSDFKEFNKEGIKYGVGQIEVVDYSEVEERRDELMKELNAVKEANGYKLCILMVTNIMEEATKLWFSGDPEIIKKAFGKEPANNEVYLPGVMSRKKQVVPKIQELIV